MDDTGQCRCPRPPEHHSLRLCPHPDRPDGGEHRRHRRADPGHRGVERGRRVLRVPDRLLERICRRRPLTQSSDGLAFSPTTSDFSFTTYVNTGTSVPEPGTLGLLVVGLTGLGWAHRRRGRAARA
ncbi:MAG: PEP-CTERM sorting domain-containing protein [Hyphomicrobiales bacterium]|nr:PEP-CTERM sorting domain-containing protein [Hyphomicrobiales bacterium]